MEYMTVKETAKKWNVSIRTVNMHLSLIHISEPTRRS